MLKVLEFVITALDVHMISVILFYLWLASRLQDEWDIVGWTQHNCCYIINISLICIMCTGM